ncbi:hypothetical protein LCGC14_2056350 [marine sediment metagenome]|uniref:PD-(D/E)XK endonuclease-like domain-containing protein n=1 Tax=marine sediment metagenome TaxID=412755 RepID=A0A0F9HJJ0_9ZZZZ
MSKEIARDKKGYYTIDKIPHVSVTTFLKVINKAFLYGWNGRMEQKGVLHLIRRLKKKDKSSQEILKKVKKYVKRSTTAAERYTFKRGAAGNVIHKAIDHYLRTGKKATIKNKIHRKAFHNFLKWWETAGYKVIKSEQGVSDKKLRVAGTIDVYLLRIKDKAKGIGDWKTGKGIYLESHLQNVTYRHLARKEFPSTFGIIVHVPQDGGKIKVYEVDTKKYPLKMALCALELYRYLYES